jgi:hypothetical protein
MEEAGVFMSSTTSPAIFCRHGDEISTSDMEDLHRFHLGSSTPLCHQVVRPRWLGCGQRLWIFFERVCHRIQNANGIKGAPEQHILVPRRRCLEDADEMWRRHPWTTLLVYLLF